jgi:hypothetical protein
MADIALFWLLVIATLVVFGVEIYQYKRKNLQ